MAMAIDESWPPSKAQLTRWGAAERVSTPILAPQQVVQLCQAASPLPVEWAVELQCILDPGSPSGATFLVTSGVGSVWQALPLVNLVPGTSTVFRIVGMKVEVGVSSTILGQQTFALGRVSTVSRSW
jgi:hypothetical protein